MEDSCPATPIVLAGRDSKSPVQVAVSSPESNGVKSPSDRVSPDSSCVICLGRLQNKSFTDSCLHQFCFQCLLQWSKVKPECPLCKQPFKSIIHNVRSNLDYDQYHVVHGEPQYVFTGFMNSYDFNFIPVDRRFRYRSTMTREYFRDMAEGFLAQTRRLHDDLYHILPRVPVDPTPAHNVRRSNRLHASSMQQRSRQRGTSDFRRNVYAQDLWVQDLSDISGRYRECTPQFYRENPAQIHRIIPWLSRELVVLLNDSESHPAYVLDQIVSMLPQHCIRSREFREVIEPYFGSRTDHFIHELYTFARSVYDIAGFDQNAVYGTNPNYAIEVQEISSSNDEGDSDIEILETVVKSGTELKSDGEEPVAGPSGLNSIGANKAIKVWESDPNEIQVLDYVKPEPEVVILSSGEETPVYYDLDFPETESGKAVKKIDGINRKRSSSDAEYVLPNERKKARHKSGKGKCKSNGFGLKGKQKRKYIKSRKYRSRSSSRSSTSSTASSSSCRSTSTSSTSSRSSSSSNIRRSKSRRSKIRKSQSVSPVSCSSSEYKTPNKLRRKKSKASRLKKNKKKVSYKSSHRILGSKRNRSGHSSNGESEIVKTKKKVKSCVIVPNVPSRDVLISPYSNCKIDLTVSSSKNSRKNSEDHSHQKMTRSTDSYRCHSSNSVKMEKRLKRREESTEREWAKSKSKYFKSSNEDASCRRIRDSSVSSVHSSENSFGVECVLNPKYSNNVNSRIKNSKSKNQRETSTSSSTLENSNGGNHSDSNAVVISVASSTIGSSTTAIASSSSTSNNYWTF